MIIREPVVNATYYYLREAPGDSPARRQDRHDAFLADVQHTLQAVSGWLSLPTPALPAIPAWQGDPPSSAQLVMQTGELAGRINASAWLSVYVLRNMLLLRVMVARTGEHDQAVWSLLDDSLVDSPTTPSWLYTTRYWCGIAPRPPEDLEQERALSIKAPFGVLCLGQGTLPHVLVYPDARTESRAHAFLGSLAAQLDWYTVQAHYRLEEYSARVASAIHTQQVALDQVARSMQDWAVPDGQNRLRSLQPLHTDLTALETAYRNMLADLVVTRSAAQEVHALMAEFRLTLMQYGLWDAAPTVWEARVAGLAGKYAQIEADVQHIDSKLRELELMMQALQMRVALLQGERERLHIYLIITLGLALLAVLVADTNITRVVVRLLAMVIVAGGIWAMWRVWLRSHLP